MVDVEFPAMDNGPSSRISPEAVLRRFEDLCGPGVAEKVELLLPAQCRAAAAVLNVDAVGVSLMLDTGMRMPLGASDQHAKAAEQLQFTLGEGPCLDAYTSNGPILVADVTDRGSRAWVKWPLYAEDLLDRTPFKAVFALPLTAEGMTIGAVSLYRLSPGILSALDLADALAVTNRIFDNLIASGTFDGRLQPSFRWLDLPMARTRTVVWQALGMATVELGLNPPDALALLRSYSYGHDKLIDDVAAEVVSGTLQLDGLHP